ELGDAAQSLLGELAADLPGVAIRMVNAADRLAQALHAVIQREEQDAWEGGAGRLGAVIAVRRVARCLAHSTYAAITSARTLQPQRRGRARMRLAVDRIRAAEARAMAEHLRERHPELHLGATAGLGDGGSD